MASPRTVILRASHMQSITQGFRMVIGEDTLLNFQMCPPVDISGWTINMKMVTQQGGGTSVGTISAATIVDGPRGLFTLSLPSALTSGLNAGRYVWDIRADNSGAFMTLADGFLELKQNYTT